MQLAPTYDDAETDYHDPNVENLEHALPGIHAGLIAQEDLDSTGYRGIALYCEWEMTADKWQLLTDHFLRPSSADIHE